MPVPDVPSDAPRTAEELLATLRQAADPGELPAIERRLGPGDQAFGIRMRDLFDAARAAAGLPLTEVEQLFDSPFYEARMAAVCVLDFRARRRGTTGEQRAELHDLYLARHDRVTVWDMVDRAAPSVVGGHLVGRPAAAALLELAASPGSLRRRTAITAPLWFTPAAATPRG